ncbi:MAG: hypothetical protein NXI00_15790, partial [Cytophagales bacterium]|nr:hypothetical protein [Cytophagales bacterium]
YAIEHKKLIEARKGQFQRESTVLFSFLELYSTQIKHSKTKSIMSIQDFSTDDYHVNKPLPAAVSSGIF